MQQFQEPLRQIMNWLPVLLESVGITIGLTIASVTTALVMAVFLALGKIAAVHRHPNARLRRVLHAMQITAGAVLLAALLLLLWKNMLPFRLAALASGIALFVLLMLDELTRVWIVRALSSAYIFFFRGTPLLLQLFFLYYGLTYIHPSLNLSNRFAAAWIAFSLNIAAYMAEIIRAAVQSIPKGQMEASHAVGLSYGQTMRMIIIPQAYRRMIPPICNEFVMVLKDTSLVSIISLADLSYKSTMISTSSATTLVYAPAMVLYLLMTAMFTIVFNRLEKRLSAHE